jgi:hypothetical protein
MLRKDKAFKLQTHLSPERPTLIFTVSACAFGTITAYPQLYTLTLRETYKGNIPIRITRQEYQGQPGITRLFSDPFPLVLPLLYRGFLT